MIRGFRWLLDIVLLAMRAAFLLAMGLVAATFFDIVCSVSCQSQTISSGKTTGFFGGCNLCALLASTVALFKALLFAGMAVVGELQAQYSE